MLPAEDLCLTAGRYPHINMSAADHRACVVDQEATEILLARIQLDISGEREEFPISRDDPRAHVSSPSRCAAQTVRRHKDRDRLPGLEWPMHRPGPAFRCGKNHNSGQWNWLHRRRSSYG